jgi:amphi-Trp domain-containing protein
MGEKEEFEYTEKISAEEAAEYLNKIAEGLRVHLLRLQGKGQTITMIPEDVLKLEVKVELKESKGKLKWRYPGRRNTTPPRRDWICRRHHSGNDGSEGAQAKPKPKPEEPAVPA